MKNSLKKKLFDGDPCIGMFVTIDSVEIVELLGIAGYDFVVIDMEHGIVDTSDLLPLVIAAERREITPIVRIPDITPYRIVKALDMGVQGLQAPQINNIAESSSIISASKYFPKGFRGMGSPRAGDYGGIALSEYINDANEETLIIVQCESKEGFDNIEAIASNPEIDVVFFGPYDMSQSLGIPGKVQDPVIDKMRDEIVRITKKYNKIPGTFAQTGDEAKKLREQGFQYITIGMEVDHIVDKFKDECVKAKVNK